MSLVYYYFENGFIFEILMIKSYWYRWSDVYKYLWFCDIVCDLKNGDGFFFDVCEDESVIFCELCIRLKV